MFTRLASSILLCLLPCQSFAQSGKPTFLDCTIYKYDQLPSLADPDNRVSMLRQDHLKLRVYVYNDGRISAMRNPHYTLESLVFNGGADWKLEKTSSRTEEEIKTTVVIENKKAGIYDSTTYILDRSSLILDIWRFMVLRKTKAVKVGDNWEVNDVLNFKSEASCSKSPEPPKLL